MSARFQAVFFDFGGTLFSYADMNTRARGAVWEAVERLGLSVPRREVGKAYRKASQEAFAAVVDKPFYLHRDVFRDTFARFAAELGCEPAPDFLDWIHVRQRKSVVDNFVLRSDCMRTLEVLRAEGLHVSIVSNIDDDYLLPMIQRSGLATRLDAWTSSEEAGSCKPDPAIYHYALRKAGTTSRDTLFVGDSLEADIAGANAVGMKSVHLHESDAPAPNAGVGTPGRPDHVIEGLSEVLAVAGIA